MTKKITREEIEALQIMCFEMLKHYPGSTEAKEATLKRMDATFTLALQAEAMQPRPLRELTSRVAVIERLGRDTYGSYHIIVHKHPDGRWREAGAHMSCGHFDDNEPGIPLTSLPEPRR